MHIPLILLAALVAVPTRAADLHCLTVAWWNPFLGAICHFKPTLFGQAEQQVVEDVEKGVEDVKDLVEFDLKYNPVSIAYRAINATVHGGAGAGATVLGDTGRAYEDLTIGFGEGVVNQGVQIYDILSWQDVSWCLIKGAGKLVTQKRRKMRRDGRSSGLWAREAARPSDDDAKAMAAKCLSDKFKKITGPAYFNITDPNQQIGSTISLIATLFIPVAPEAEAAGGATTGAFDLAVAGSEDVRILKKVGEDSVAEHFASEDEAQLVKENLRDEKWAEENCGTCPLQAGGASSSLTQAGNTATARLKRRAGHSLWRRGAGFSTCCKVPQTIESGSGFGDGLAAEDNPFSSHPSIPLEDYQPQAMGDDLVNQEGQTPKISTSPAALAKIFDAANYAKLVETDIVASPEYTAWALSEADSTANIGKDLDQFNTAVIAWSPDMKAVTSSEDLFTLLRKTFQGSKDDAIYKGLKVYARNGEQRLASRSVDWIDGTTTEMKPLRDLVTASLQHGKDAVAKLKGLTPEDAATRLDGNVEFFWCAPGDDALKGGVDPRGLHVDAGLMQFGAQDTPGLVVQNRLTGSISRPPVDKDSLQLVKAHYWDPEAEIRGAAEGATPHGVFGSEMAENGRVSMVMSISYKYGANA